FVTGWIGQTYGLRPYPFYLGIFLALAGLVTSAVFVRDTHKHVALESGNSPLPKLRSVFWQTTWKHKELGSITQAGLVNNLNDGMVWGLFPLILVSKGFNLTDTGVIVATYPAVWGLGQLFTGPLADMYCKKKLLFLGMLLQGIALVTTLEAESFYAFIGLSALLGIGTAIVYPTFLAAVSEHTHPQQRAHAIGIFRLWRDSGYAFGAILTGLIADRFGLEAPVIAIGLLTIVSALIVRHRMLCPPLRRFKESGEIRSAALE
ncbi:MAG TPA: MFS transporter, partial [Chryseosolibacter sp.]|nr:MFS transporter [Chryseosolibacter sp.]